MYGSPNEELLVLNYLVAIARMKVSEQIGDHRFNMIIDYRDQKRYDIRIR